MAIHNILGKAGEDAAAKYLEQNGYTIRDRNWRKNHLELVLHSLSFQDTLHHKPYSYNNILGPSQNL